jgi:acid phosphatase
MAGTRRRRLLALVVVAALVIPLFVAVVALLLRTPANPGSTANPGAASGTSGTSPVGSHIGGASSSSPLAGPLHIWLIVLENHSYGQIIGSSQAPNLNRLAERYGLATDFHAVARPSQPNYLALVSGSTQGVTNDHSHDLSAPSLFDQLEAAGLDWQVNAENVPGECFTGGTASGGPDGPGTYARKHEPAISFTAVSRDAARCWRIRNLSAFDPSAAAFTLVIPNLCHDMHDCPVAVADGWLGTFVPRITDSAAFRDGGLLLITFDESDGDDRTQHIPLIYVAPNVAAGSHATQRATHYSLLRTIEDAFGLPCLAQACDAEPMAEVLR